MLRAEEGNVLVNLTDNSKSTALHYCAYYGISEIAILLLEHHADILLKDLDGLTAYDIATLGSLESHVAVAVLLRPYYLSAKIPVAIHPMLISQKQPIITDLLTNKRPNSGTSRVAEKQNETVSSTSPLKPRTISSPKSSSKMETSKLRNESLLDVSNSETALPVSLPFKLCPPEYEVPFLPLQVSLNQMYHIPNNKLAKSGKETSIIVVLSVEQCHHCSRHAYCLWHDESKYNNIADEALLHCVCTLQRECSFPITVFAYKHLAPKARVGALEIIMSILVPNTVENEQISSQKLQACKLNNLNDAGNVLRQTESNFKASSTSPINQKPLFVLPGAISYPVVGTTPVAEITSEMKQALANNHAPKQGKIWLHHVLHSKLKSKK